ncbi:hypothetical protein CVCC1112_966 [Paenarthrobacter nicotinovorans]|nr:hypothetical protein CVCC1112_966 [Paenarthrobacter nicotinovorans]
MVVGAARTGDVDGGACVRVVVNSRAAVTPPNASSRPACLIPILPHVPRA